MNLLRSSSGLKPINGILARDSGNKFPNLKPMNTKYGLNIGAIVDMPVEVGISKVLGMQMFKAGDVQDYETKAAVLPRNYMIWTLYMFTSKVRMNSDTMETRRKRNTVLKSSIVRFLVHYCANSTSKKHYL